MQIELSSRELIILHRLATQPKGLPREEVLQVLQEVYGKIAGTVVAYVKPPNGSWKRILLDLSNFTVEIYNCLTNCVTDEPKFNRHPSCKHKCADRESAELLLWGVHNIVTMMHPETKLEVFRVFDGKEVLWPDWLKQLNPHKKVEVSDETI